MWILAIDALAAGSFIFYRHWKKTHAKAESVGTKAHK
jgi:hypothetical protein